MFRELFWESFPIFFPNSVRRKVPKKRKFARFACKTLWNLAWNKHFSRIQKPQNEK